MVFSPYSFSCPLSVTLFTKMLSGCKEQGFGVGLHEYILPAISPNSGVPERLLRGACEPWRHAYHWAPGMAGEGHQPFVGLWMFAAELPVPFMPAPGRVPLRGCSRKQKAGWARRLAGSPLSACPCKLLCMMGVLALVRLLSAQFSICLAVSPSTSETRAAS